MAPDNIDATMRAWKALELRRQGYQWQEIAEEVGYADRASAYNAARRLLDRTEFEAVEEYRALEADRLDQLHRVQLGHLLSLPKTGDPSVVSAASSAVSSLVRISDRRSKLLGLDAPVRVSVGASDVDFAAEASRLMRDLAAAGALEAAPADGEEDASSDEDEEDHRG
ncbi:hypothetical protein OED52_13765 [Rhodococcus sp. Z13]|uniref:Uncharacterized protein n=1 Tax=Rhodococcus sacchari TaxID=2962047 RepID=A0ACD4DCH6_9NOCA|nr:hypothetical protein [Rhodococcus sp. Z13]UYP17739.1 hypothetical protein OED52_13765 [Rhodococcus sp. Z13]